MSGRNESSPVAASTDPEIRRLGEQLRAFLRSDEFLSRLNIGKIITVATGAAAALAWGDLNRVQSNGGLLQLPPIEPAWIGKPLYLSKLTPSGIVTVIPSGKPSPYVDGSATGIQIGAVGLREFITDGVDWFSH